MVGQYVLDTNVQLASECMILYSKYDFFIEMSLFISWTVSQIPLLVCMQWALISKVWCFLSKFTLTHYFKTSFIVCFTKTQLQYIPRNMHTVLLCIALLWLCNRSWWIHMKYLSIFIRVALLALGQLLDCHSASEVSLMDMGKSVNV